MAARAGDGTDHARSQQGAPEPARVWYERSMAETSEIELETEEAEGPPGPPETRREFLDALERLRRGYQQDGENIGSNQCTGCSHCASCIFCEGCTGCYRSNYCKDCEGSSGCNHCERCKSCHGCAHCVDCEECVGSAYLDLCTSCSDSSYCFGCVGLQKADFHILNVPYDRSTYFAAVKRLKRELGLR